MHFLSSVRLLCLYMIIASGLIISCENSSEDSADPSAKKTQIFSITEFSVSPGSLSPEFNTEHKNYNLNLPAGVSEISLTIDFSDGYEIFIENSKINSGVSTTLSVSDGDVIEVNVKSPGGIETIYTVAVKGDEDTAGWEKVLDFTTSYKPGGILCHDSKIYIHQGSSIYSYYQTGNPDTSWGDNGRVSGFTSSASNDVGISIDTAGNLYVPSSGSGNVEMVSADKTVSTLILDGEGLPIDIGLTKAVAVNQDGSILYLAQTRSRAGMICGVYRFACIEGRWLPATGENGTVAWAEGGVMVNDDLNSNMRSLCILSDGRILVGCGSTSKKIFEIQADGTSVREVVNLSASGENCGGTGSCNYIAVCNNLLFVPVIVKTAGEYSNIRVYNITAGEYTLNTVISSDSQKGIVFPGNGSEVEIRGISAISESTIVYALSDESVTIISYK